MSLTGRRVAILVADQYEDLELWYPKLRLEEAGATVTLAGMGQRTYLSKHGYPATADANVGELEAADFDGVVVPGGWAPDYLRRSPAVTRFVAAVAGRKDLVASICHGPWVLISAGVVAGRRMTSVESIRDDLCNAGALWEDAAVVVDGNVVTSRRPADLPAFLPAVIAVLEERAHRGTGVRAVVDGDVIAFRLQQDSVDYMLEMLIRMPAAKAYREGTTPDDHDPVTLVRDFVSSSDPRGPLEAETPVVVDVTPTAAGYLARGNRRVLSVLRAAGVPGIEEIPG
ncbi:MAG: hypothetical protein Kow00122_21440 [Thermoleophilia bacterium]